MGSWDCGCGRRTALRSFVALEAREWGHKVVEVAWEVEVVRVHFEGWEVKFVNERYDIFCAK
jgi:hypothetical protein